MELVLYPHEVETPDDGPWVKRLKYTTVAELLSDYETSNAAHGVAHCPVADFLRQHLDDPLDEVEAYVYGHPQWGPIALAETMWKTLAFNHAASHPHGEHIAGWIQRFCVRELVKHDWNNARHAISEMLKTPEMTFKSPEAQKALLAHFIANHPSPAAFFAKYPEAAAKFPGLNPADYPAPDFESAT